MAMELAEVLNRVSTLRQQQEEARQERFRIRAIMNGGVDGVYAVMAWDMGKGSSSRQQIAEAYGVDLPTVNLMHSGTERMAQTIGRPPTLKAPFVKDEDLRAEHQRRADIVSGWDKKERMRLHYPQVGRWLPGYSYAVWTMVQRYDSDTPWPSVELRDSFDSYPGWFTANRQPDDFAHVRRVPMFSLKAAYPQLDWDTADGKLRSKRGAVGSRGGVLLDMSTVRSYDGQPLGYQGDRTGVEVIEYHYSEGMHFVIPEIEMEMAFIPNPLDSGPAFVFAKRFSFDKDISHYHHVIGLQSMMAKMNILGLVASEDSSFKETNIIGQMIGKEYERGRFATNLFEPGTVIDRPTGDVPQQIWAQIDRLERQLRIGAAYDVAQDAISPNSYATGNAVRELRSGLTNNVREYHTALSDAIEQLDSKRLEWAEKMWRGDKTKIFYLYTKEATYVPATDIAGVYDTRRVYGAMATWDDSLKATVGLQYLAAEILDRETLQENVDNLEDIELVNMRISKARAMKVLFARLQMRSEQDPKADAALVEIVQNPDQEEEILLKYFTPQEPQISEEELAQMQQMMQQAQPALPAGGPPPPVTTTLNRIESSGASEQGVQTVGRLA